METIHSMALSFNNHFPAKDMVPDDKVLSSVTDGKWEETEL